jgi:hypothetical protein
MFYSEQEDGELSIAAQQQWDARAAFRLWMRTGLALEERDGRIGVKFNPYHDPDNGRFTFAPGGPRSLPGAIRVPQRSRPGLPQARPDTAPPPSNPLLVPAQYRPPPRGGIGGNSRAFQDPMTLQPVIPPVQNVPGGTIIALTDSMMGYTDTSQRAPRDLTAAHVRNWVAEIRRLDPKYRLDISHMPATAEGQSRLMTSVLRDRAWAYLRIKGDPRPLQAETTRSLQRWTDEAYATAVQLQRQGKLRGLSPEHAIGSYIDRQVRGQLRKMHGIHGIRSVGPNIVRVNAREYNTSTSETAFRIPDARVAQVAYDVTITRKTFATPQVRGYFSADFKPNIVVIIRPRQLGPNASYAIVVNTGAHR